MIEKATSTIGIQIDDSKVENVRQIEPSDLGIRKESECPNPKEISREEDQIMS